MEVKNKGKRIAILLFVFFTIVNLFGQKKFMKLGKMDLTKFNETCSYDSTAEAVVLGEYGELTFGGNMAAVLRYHRRVKILNESALSRAEVKIKYHKDEIFKKPKAYVYNVVGGQLVAQKVEKESYYTESLEDGFFEFRMTFPNVKVGSVIEYEYSVEAGDYYNLKTWNFQDDIPMLRSEYWVLKPSGINYQILPEGDQSFVTFTKEMSIGTTSVFHWTAQNCPAFHEEPFVDNIDNYISRVEFEFVSINIPGVVYKTVAASYPEFFKRLLTNYESFGDAIDNSTFLKDETDAIVAAESDKLAQMEKIRQFIANKVSWNGKSSIYSTFGTKLAYKQGTGNCADINFMLIYMLRRAGFSVQPLVLSTRSHGTLSFFTFVAKQLNYVIAYVSYEGKEYLLDATEPNLEFNQLPFRCLNGKGAVVNPNANKWVDLLRNEKYESTTMATLTFSSPTELEGRIAISQGGYSALNTRNEIRNSNEEEFIKSYKKDNSELEIKEFSLENISSLNEKVKINYQSNFSSHVEFLGNTILVNPMAWATRENKFKAVERKYPINFGCPEVKTYMATIEIPDGYVVEELPEKATVMLAGNSGRYMYSAAQSGNKITVMARYMMTRAEFAPSDYEFIRQFFDQIVKAENQKIVLKKI